jgi:hypothetical protein
MYVRAVLDQAIDTTAILAPQQGITRDPKGSAVAMVVSKTGTVEPRTLDAGRAIGDRWLVTSGLADGDKLIIEGLNKIGPGMPVHATEVKPGAAAAPGAPAPGAPDAKPDAKPDDKPAATPPAPAAKPTSAGAGSGTKEAASTTAPAKGG